METPKCEYYEVCGLDADADPELRLCILHSRDPNKDKQAFTEVLSAHRQEKGDNFECIVFPEFAEFREVEFSGRANFAEATFSGWTDFAGATFSEGADFRGALFKDGDVNFMFSSFLGRTTFTGRMEDEQTIPIFSEVKVDFRDVNIGPPEALIFRDADLSHCKFQGTRIGKVEFTKVDWPLRGKRFGFIRRAVYDERALSESIKAEKDRRQKRQKKRLYAHIERIYRDLKKNHEEEKDYERAGEFHYGEKEMRRKNPDSSPLLRFILTIYWLISGYGERYIRPLIWALVLLLACAIGYLVLGIAPKDKASLAVTNWKDWLHVGLYSLQVMTFLKPTDLVPLGLAATSVKVFQSIVGPIFIGLFALAVRQRLRR